MSLLEKASLIITPNSYKESKLYSVVPNTTLGDMDVVRATTATRVNEQGLIEVVPRNLAIYSEDFTDPVWFKSSITIIGNATTAPNGTITADKIIEDSTNDFHITGINTNIVSGQQYTLSFYAKASERNFARILAGSPPFATIYAYFDLVNGITTTNATSSAIESIGSGWFRCSMTLTATSTSNGVAIWFGPALNMTDTYSAYQGISGNGIFGWGAQINIGTLKPYFPTTTRLNIPRIDYTNGSCPSLLVEPQRTNLITYSEQFSNANWAKDSISVLENTAISPDGTTNADKIYPSVSATVFIYQLASSTSSISKSFSIYVKAAGKNYCWILNSSGSIGCRFDLINGTVVNTPSGNIGTIKNVGNGWYKITNTYTSLDSYGGIGPCDSASTNAVTINGTDGIFVYGAQLEVGSYATSYIPTVASTSTRNADVISKTGISSLIGQTEGTLFCEFNALGYYDLNNMIITLSDATTTNRIFLNLTDGVGNLEAVITASGVTTVSYLGTVPTIGNHKIALSYKNNDVVIYLDGILIYSDNTVTIPLTSKLNIGSYVNDSNQFNSRINSAQLYKTRLTNTELAQLTTL